MKVTLYMAMSADGIIARETGEEDFLSHENWKMFEGLAKELGCFIVGRKTYEAVMKWEEDYNFDIVETRMKIIVSSGPEFKPKEGYTLASSPRDALEKAEAAGFEQVLLTGGAGMNSSFMKEGLVDEIILNIEPIALGKGIRLFAEADFEARLELVGTKKLEGGILQLHYKVVK